MEETMIVQLLSDLHLEHHRDRGQSLLQSLDPAGVDVLILAGDIVQAMSADWVRSVFEAFAARYPHVLYVPGNHEYYGSRPRDVDALLEGIDLPNFHLLNPGVVTIDGQRFVGATLWFPLTDDERRYRGYLNDFNAIEGAVPWIHDAHAAHRRYLEEALAPGDVVITHHLPALPSIDPKYAGSPLNRFFWAQADDLVEQRRARLWVHGHTHVHVDYLLGETRLLANPLGYPHEQGCRFQEKLLVEL